MPKSKRNQVVALTQTKKKGRQWKEGVLASTRDAADAHAAAYVFAHAGMRNDKFKELREEVRATSRFCMGAVGLLAVALGKDEADEYRPGLARLAPALAGDVGLFFTNLPHAEVVRIFGACRHRGYARAGARATATFALPAGPLVGPTGPLPHTLEPSLRAAGLPTKLVRGVVTLIADSTVCRAGERLTPGSASLLRTFGQKQAVFSLRLLRRWDRESGEVEVLAEGGKGGRAGSDGEDGGGSSDGDPLEGEA